MFTLDSVPWYPNLPMYHAQTIVAKVARAYANECAQKWCSSVLWCATPDGEMPEYASEWQIAAYYRTPRNTTPSATRRWIDSQK